MDLKKIQSIISEKDYDALLLSGLENPKAANNLYYATGYTGSYGFAIIGKDFEYFISDFRYREQAQIEAKNYTFVEIKDGLINTLKEIIEKENIENLGFDGLMRYSEYQMYEKLNITLTPVNGLIESFREVKNKIEIKKLKKACEITDEALKYALKQIKEGMMEKELEVILKTKMIELGADKTWDRFIVASGVRGSMPHGMASDKPIKKGELITFDIGCFYEGYTSDLTRTIAFGEVSVELKKIYNIVLEAQLRGVKSAKAGMTGKALDSVCRDYIDSKGYKENFAHGTGHGVGLDVHEGPRVSQAYDKPLKAGACVTIEPGIYVEGLGGVRIEDDIILTEDGNIVLNEFPKELIIID